MNAAIPSKRAARPLARRLRDALLLALLASSALGLGVLAVWVLAPDRVDALDRLLLHAYVARVDDRLAAAEAALRAGRRAEGQRGLEDLLFDLEEVQKRDRFHRRKRRAFELLSRELAGEDPDRALAVYDGWLAFDPRDAEARVARVRLLASRPAGRAEARAELARLVRQLPGMPAVALAQVELLRLQGRAEEADRELLAASRRLPWKLSWTGGEGFALGRRQREILPRWSHAGLAFETSLPPGVESLALHAPEGVAFSIAPRTARLERDGRPPLDLLGPDASPCPPPAPGETPPALCWRAAQPVAGPGGSLLVLRARARALLPHAASASGTGPTRGSSG